MMLKGVFRKGKGLGSTPRVKVELSIVSDLWKNISMPVASIQPIKAQNEVRFSCLPCKLELTIQMNEWRCSVS